MLLFKTTLSTTWSAKHGHLHFRMRYTKPSQANGTGTGFEEIGFVASIREMPHVIPVTDLRKPQRYKAHSSHPQIFIEYTLYASPVNEEKSPALTELIISLETETVNKKI